MITLRRWKFGGEPLGGPHRNQLLLVASVNPCCTTNTAAPG
jgi:hypothetical protein